MSEVILGIFPAFIQEGKGKRSLAFAGEACKLVFTTSRLIVTEDKRLGGNLLFRPTPHYVFSQVSTRDRLKMEAQSPERILALSGANIKVPYEDIIVIELTQPPLDNWILRVFTKDLNAPDYTITICQGTKMYEAYLAAFQVFLDTVLPGKT